MSTAPAPGACLHCGAALEGDEPYCCAGCTTAAAIISGAGLDRYYQERVAFAPRPAGPSLALAVFPTEVAGEVRFAIDGLQCASCVWVTEKVLQRTPGVRDAAVSYGSGRAFVHFDPDQIDVGAIVGRVAALGYRPRPIGDAPTGDRDLLVRLGVAAFCAANVMLLSASLYSGWFDGMDPRYAALFRWTALALATPSALYAATPFFAGAWQGLKNGLPHMDLPIALGVAILYGEGVVATLAGTEGYLDSLTMLVALLLAGRLLESRGRRRAQQAAEALSGALPRVARRVVGMAVETVPVGELRVGDHLEIGAGEEVAADGEVETGHGEMRMAMLTGESEPVPIDAGCHVVAGAILADGAIRLRVTATGGELLVERMAAELANATERGTTRGLPDRIAPWFTLVTLAVAATTFAGWSLALGWHAAVAPTVAVLVVACPCALALAQPLAVATGLGAAARRGLLVRSGDALLRLGEIDRVVLDKTGTITAGEPSVVSAEDATLRLAAGLERYSVHPVARAIVAEAVRRGIPLPSGTDVRETAGQGITGRVDGLPVTIRSAGAGRVQVEGAGGGEILLRDVVRADARRAIEAMRASGLDVRLLSGDHPEVVQRISAEVGIEGEAAIQPLDKAARLRAWRTLGHRVLFAGDGLNDGPALAAADVGIAMGGGAASSVLVADGIVARDALAPILAGIRAGRAVRAVVRANLARSLAYNAIAVAAAAAGLVNPLVAAVLMPLSSSLVVWGALGVERRVRREERWTP